MSRHDDCEPLDKRLSSIVFLDLSGVSEVYLYLAAAFVLVCTLLATIFFEIIINMIAKDFSWLGIG